jgi:ADP-ribose pyrophosphatase
VIHLYIAKGLVHQGAQRLDAGEFVDVLRLPLSELEGMMRKGWVPDVKTQLGIFWLKDGLAGQ